MRSCGNTSCGTGASVTALPRPVARDKRAQLVGEADASVYDRFRNVIDRKPSRVRAEVQSHDGFRDRAFTLHSDHPDRLVDD
jgi:hypothetical protein